MPYKIIPDTHPINFIYTSSATPEETADESNSVSPKSGRVEIGDGQEAGNMTCRQHLSVVRGIGPTCCMRRSDAASRWRTSIRWAHTTYKSILKLFTDRIPCTLLGNTTISQHIRRSQNDLKLFVYSRPSDTPLWQLAGAH